MKNTHIIEFEPAGMAPLQRRNNPKFSHYFNLIWKELDQND